MLSAMSTDSIRDELRALAHYLKTRLCIITDWPASATQRGHGWTTTRGEYALGRAVNIPLRELEARLAELTPDRDIVAYCRDPYGVLSYEAVALLRERGFRVRRLVDGLPEWRSAGPPTDRFGWRRAISIGVTATTWPNRPRPRPSGPRRSRAARPKRSAGRDQSGRG